MRILSFAYGDKKLFGKLNIYFEQQSGFFLISKEIQRQCKNQPIDRSSHHLVYGNKYKVYAICYVYFASFPQNHRTQNTCQKSYLLCLKVYIRLCLTQLKVNIDALTFSLSFLFSRSEIYILQICSLLNKMYFAGRRFLHYGYVLNLKSTLLFTLQIIRIMIKKKKRAIDLAALIFFKIFTFLFTKTIQQRCSSQRNETSRYISTIF